MFGSDLLVLFASGIVGTIAAVEGAVRLSLAGPLRKLASASSQSVQTIRDDGLSDDEKSEKVLTHSRQIVLASVSILWRIGAILGFWAIIVGSMLVIVFGVDITELVIVLSDWRLQLVALVTAIIYLWVRKHVAKQL